MICLKPFSFDGSTVRVQVDNGGVPWFNVNDVCCALGIASPRDAIARHVDVEDIQKRNAITAGGRQRLNHVNESGLYALLLGTNTDNADRFLEWAASEVLPSIRMTGAYATKGATHGAYDKVGTLAALRDAGLLSADEAKAAALALLELSPDLLRPSAPSALPQALRIFAARKPGSKPSAPRPIKIDNIPFGGLDGLDFILDEVADFVVGGRNELYRAMVQFGLVGETGALTTTGLGLVARKSSRGTLWRVGDLLRFLSGSK